jgi:hypothetical protein
MLAGQGKKTVNVDPIFRPWIVPAEVGRGPAMRQGHAGGGVIAGKDSRLENAPASAVIFSSKIVIGLLFFQL